MELVKAIEAAAIAGIKEELKMVADHVQQIKDLAPAQGVGYITSFGRNFGPYDFDVAIELYGNYTKFLNDILRENE